MSDVLKARNVLPCIMLFMTNFEITKVVFRRKKTLEENSTSTSVKIFLSPAFGSIDKTFTFYRRHICEDWQMGLFRQHREETVDKEYRSSALLEPYITNVRGVDRGDQITDQYNVGRTSRISLYNRLCCFWKLQNLNAYIVEGHVDDRHAEIGHVKRDFRAFRLELAVDLIGGYSGRKRRGRKRQRKDLRLDATLPHLPVATHSRLLCVRCSEKGK